MTRGYDIYEDEDGNIIKWKRCEVENCENGVCYSLNPDNKFCWPHSMTGGCKELKTKKRRKQMKIHMPPLLKTEEMRKKEFEKFWNQIKEKQAQKELEEKKEKIREEVERRRLQIFTE